jgi:hypothetical protein
MNIRKQDLAALKAQADEIDELVQQGRLTKVDQRNLLGMIYREYEQTMAEDQQRTDRAYRILAAAPTGEPISHPTTDFSLDSKEEKTMSITAIMGRIAAHSQRIDDMSTAMQQAPRPAAQRFESGLTTPDALANAALAHVCESAAMLMGSVARVQEAASSTQHTAFAGAGGAAPPSGSADVVDVEVREIKP